MTSFTSLPKELISRIARSNVDAHRLRAITARRWAAPAESQPAIHRIAKVLDFLIDFPDFFSAYIKTENSTYYIRWISHRQKYAVESCSGVRRKEDVLTAAQILSFFHSVSERVKLISINQFGDGTQMSYHAPDFAPSNLWVCETTEPSAVARLSSLIGAIGPGVHIIVATRINTHRRKPKRPTPPQPVFTRIEESGRGSYLLRESVGAGYPPYGDPIVMTKEDIINHFMQRGTEVENIVITFKRKDRYRQTEATYKFVGPGWQAPPHLC